MTSPQPLVLDLHTELVTIGIREDAPPRAFRVKVTVQWSGSRPTQ